MTDSPSVSRARELQKGQVEVGGGVMCCLGGAEAATRRVCERCGCSVVPVHCDVPTRKTRFALVSEGKKLQWQAWKDHRHGFGSAASADTG